MFFFVASPINAQDNDKVNYSKEELKFSKVDASPMDLALYRDQDDAAVARVIYSRPQKRNREIFGKLVPYGEVWRTGANEATEVTLYKDMKVADATGLSRKTTEFENFHHGFTGIVLLDGETGKNIYRYNAHKSFTPASNTKILSLYSAINSLEDSIVTFRYRETEDSLIFSSTGDPGLLDSEVSSNSPLQFLRNSKDSIYYQKANWKQEIYGAGWSWDDFEYAFSPQISAIPVYGNTVSFTMVNKNLKVSPRIFTKYTQTINSETLEKLKGTNQFRVPQKLQKNDTLRIPFETSEEFQDK